VHELPSIGRPGGHTAIGLTHTQRRSCLDAPFRPVVHAQTPSVMLQMASSASVIGSPSLMRSHGFPSRLLTSPDFGQTLEKQVCRGLGVHAASKATPSQATVVLHSGSAFVPYSHVEPGCAHELFSRGWDVGHGASLSPGKTGPASSTTLASATGIPGVSGGSGSA